jgi:hypothetical protein
MSGGDSQLAIATVKNYVDSHIEQLVENRYSLQSVEEYGDLLDTPTDMKTLERRRHILTEAIKSQIDDTLGKI